MIIKDIYLKLNTPPNLQKHMLCVTSLALFIQDHWTGPVLNSDTIKTLLLLHDIGNIVKFDLDKFPEFLGKKEKKRIDYWKQKQKEIINKYGRDDHEATVAILNDLNIDQNSKQGIYDMGYWNIESLVENNNWNLKVALYSDLRVGPYGITTLKERLEDIHKRLEKYRNRPELIGFAKKLEQQIQDYLDISIDRINNEKVNIDQNLLNYTV